MHAKYMAQDGGVTITFARGLGQPVLSGRRLWYTKPTAAESSKGSRA